MAQSPEKSAVIFDLDGVLTDTAELHYQSWCVVARELGFEFSRAANEALRGVSRMKSCDLMLGERADDFSEADKAEIARKKNNAYLELVAGMSQADLMPGAGELLEAVRADGMHTAVASASRNGHTVIKQLGIAALLDVEFDGNDVSESKPSPELFLSAANHLAVPVERCVVIEDAEVGVEAARRAKMAVIGIGPSERVGHADICVNGTDEIDVSMIRSLIQREKSS